MQSLTNGPDSLQPIVESGLQAIRVGMPDLHCPVLRAGDNNRQLRVKGDRGNVLRMTLQYLHAGLVLVVPDAHLSVVRARDQIGLVPAMIVIHTVHALLVALQGEIRGGGAQLPHLHGLVQ